MKRTLASCFLALSLACASSQAAPDRLAFSEVWAYLLDGEESSLSSSYPITDVCYFGAGINSHGKLVGVPNRAKLGSFKGRVQLVVAEIGNYALTHFCLDPAYPLRDALVADIVKSAEAFDGVQIDFEAVGSSDYDYFYGFLAQLKAGLGGKALSVALPARMSEKTDYFGVERIGKVVDRVLVMAYDEHWSASEPGPVASIEWCKSAAAYAASKVALGKLVMGLPFYGRAWADKSLARAYKYSSLAGLRAEKGIEAVQRDGAIPFVEYSETVKVRLYFDDLPSTRARLGMYRAANVRNVAFWRLGQEDPGVWGGISIEPSAL